MAYISQFPLGGMKLIRMDYTSPIDPEVERRCEEGVWWRKVANRLRRGKPMAWEMAEFAEREKIGGQDPSPGVGDDEKEKGEQGSGLDYRTRESVDCSSSALSLTLGFSQLRIAHMQP